MKGRYDIHHPSGYTLPVDSLRQAFGLKVPDAPPLPKPPRIKTQYIAPERDTITSKKNPDALLNFTRKFFDGSLSFDTWLELPSTNCKMLRQFEKVVRKVSDKRRDYLNQVGIGDTEMQKGEVAGKLHAAFPLVKLQEMLYKYKEELYSGMAEYCMDEKWLLTFLDLPEEPEDSDHPIIDMMDHSENREAFLSMIVSYYFRHDNVGYDHWMCKVKLHALEFFYRELMDHHENISFRTGYCAGMLKFFGMIDSKQDPYWLDESWHETLKELCAFYGDHITLDFDFVKKHFPRSIYIFTRKRAPDFHRLQTIFIKTEIYKASLRGRPFASLLKFFEKYQRISHAEIRMHKTRLSLLYRKMFLHDQMWAHRKLEGIVKIEP